MGEAGHNRRSDEAAKLITTRKHVVAPISADTPAPPATHRSEITEEEMDATIADSFPASDPPSWNSGIDRQKARPNTS